MKQPKYLDVLLFLYNKKLDGNGSIHYIPLREVIFEKEIIQKYSFAKKNKTVIDYMTCVYMGKLCRKDLVLAEYKVNKYTQGKAYAYFMGYYITEKGIGILKEKKLI
jgi:hypothetical protein